MERGAPRARFDGCSANISSPSVYLVSSDKIIIPIFTDGETEAPRGQRSHRKSRNHSVAQGREEPRVAACPTPGPFHPSISPATGTRLGLRTCSSREQALDSPELKGPNEAALSKGGMLAASCSSVPLTAQGLPLQRSRPLSHGSRAPVTHLPDFLETFNKTDRFLCVHG